jgi:hypothetical protein
MKVSKFASAVAFASALAFSGIASATATTTTFSGYDRPLSTESRTEKIDISYAGGNFNLTGVLDPFLTTLNGANTGLFLGASLYNDLDADALFTWAPEGLNLTRFTFSATNLAAGDYTLKFNLLGGGFYTGSYTVTAVTAVPEPETNALMLVGLGMIGFIARRKFS